MNLNIAGNFASPRNEIAETQISREYQSPRQSSASEGTQKFTRHIELGRTKAHLQMENFCGPVFYEIPDCHGSESTVKIREMKLVTGCVKGVQGRARVLS